MLSLRLELALFVSSASFIDSRPIHVTLDGNPQALIKNGRSDDRRDSSIHLHSFTVSLLNATSWMSKTN